MPSRLLIDRTGTGAVETARPGDGLPIRRPDGTVADMRWGLIPQGRRNARGRPVMDTLVNARSETLFAKSAWLGVRRGTLDVLGWIEMAGDVRWRIGAEDGAVLTMAVVWDVWRAPGRGIEIAQAATVTCAPSGVVAPIHDRMPVVLTGDGIVAWQGGTEAEAAAAYRPVGGLTATREGG